MRVHNKSKRMYQHGEYNLPAGANIEISKEVAEIWLATGDVVEYVDPSEAKAKEAKAKETQKALEDENAKLKAEIEKLKAEAKAKEGGAEKSLDELKKEADKLGIEYAKNIGAKALKEKIEAKKAE